MVRVCPCVTYRISTLLVSSDTFEMLINKSKNRVQKKLFKIGTYDIIVIVSYGYEDDGTVYDTVYSHEGRILIDMLTEVIFNLKKSFLLIL